MELKDFPKLLKVISACNLGDVERRNSMVVLDAIESIVTEGEDTRARIGLHSPIFPLRLLCHKSLQSLSSKCSVFPDAFSCCVLEGDWSISILLFFE